jgi:beta-galactosidase
VKDIDTTVTAGLLAKPGQPALAWKRVSLPHTAQIEPLVITGNQWQGTCFYRKFFTVPAGVRGKHVSIRFEGAMHEADVYLNGKHVFKHLGGYLPFEVNITDRITPVQENCVLVKLNNQDNLVIPPGKPMKDLYFNYYGSLYRQVSLIVKDKFYIPDLVQAVKPAAASGWNTKR